MFAVTTSGVHGPLTNLTVNKVGRRLIEGICDHCEYFSLNQLLKFSVQRVNAVSVPLEKESNDGTWRLVEVSWSWASFSAWVLQVS